MEGFFAAVAALCNALLVIGAGVGAVWFAINNYLADEIHHPLDYFSNKLRSRPHVYVMVTAGLTICAAAPVVLGISAALLDALPELAAVVYGLGLAIYGIVWSRESTAAGLLALLLYAPLALATVLIVMSPVITEDWAGWLYCNMYLFAHLFWVVWLRNSADRRDRRAHAAALAAAAADNNKVTWIQKWRGRLCCCCQRFGYCGGGHNDLDEFMEPTSLLPEGSEKLVQIWERAVHVSVPALLVISNVGNLLIYLIRERELGWAFALSFWLLACALLAGCCVEYRSGTVVE